MSFEILSVLTPQWNSPTQPFRHTWKRVGNIDQFRWFSRADVLAQLRMARDELGVRHVRAVAMYSPDMRVWETDLADWNKEKRPRQANWQFVDLNIENLLSLGLKPIYTTCFTPNGMSDSAKTCWPDGNSIGLPRDLEQWSEFVSGGIRHHIERYGIEEVRSWYFECWNEPNLDGFFDGTQGDFFRLWSATWKAVKSVDTSLRFGGPSTARGEWVPEFLDFAIADGTPPDYLITHVYNNDSASQPLSPFDGPASHRVKDSPHFANGVVRGLRAEVDRRGWKGEIHWNEWGRSWFPHDPMKETALEPAFIAKTMCEVSQEADEFAFWCLSDIYDQCGRQSSEFYGNYGMLSLHALRKQAWFAHILLGKLGDASVPVEGTHDLLGAVATIQDHKPAVLVWSYPETIDAPVERVTIHVPWPVEHAELYRLGAEENNIIADWRRMGSPAYPTPAQIAALRQGNHLQSATDLVLEKTESGYSAVFTMERPGVALLIAK